VKYNHPLVDIQPTSHHFYSKSKTWSLGPVSDPALRWSEFNGSAGKDCELFWSIGVLEY